MKKNMLIAAIVLLAAATFAAETNATPDQGEANYAKAIEGRTADILKILALTDGVRAAKVHSIILAQYRSLRAWHDENDDKIKAVKADSNAVAQIHRSLKTLHAEFLGRLEAYLSPEQIETVKDKMTYGKTQFTFTAYVAQYPDLSEVNKAEILRLLKEAREEAMDGGSAAEKSAVFQKCKGRINNYLSKQGIHPKKKAAVARPDTHSTAR